jgi:hypothetical protein
MKRYFILVILLFPFTFNLGQKAIFLLHSTGSNLFYQGQVGEWISNYNLQHSTSYQIDVRAYPHTPYPWDNYPYDYWNLWVNNQCNNTNPNIECLDKLTQDYDVIIFKHCFPGSSIVADDNNPSVSSNIKTLANYKLQYRALLSLMDSYPNKKFILLTLAPLHRLDTYAESAARARQFVDWVTTSWLTEDGKLHPNVYIFDFNSYTAERNPSPANGSLNCLKYDYELSHTESDSHPNLLANQTIGPIFAQFIINTFQNQPTGIDQVSASAPIIIYPNPASSEVNIDLKDYGNNFTSFEIYDLNGKLIRKQKSINQPIVQISTGELNNGIYILRTRTDLINLQNKLYIIK